MNPSKPEIQIVCGIIYNAEGKLLLAKRPEHLSYAGWWEFPGGKVEAGEEKLAALKRELDEEVGIHTIEAEFFKHIRHEDEEKILYLDFWLIKKFSGEAHGREGQEIQWILPEELKSIKILLANRQVVDQLMKIF